MFTGLIEEIGTVIAARPFAGGKRFEIAAPGIAPELSRGDSVACHGLCLTVEGVDAGRGRFTVAAVAETLRRTAAGSWRAGDRVHLERALAAGGRFGGHLVQGHIDGVASVVRAGLRGREHALTLRVPAGLARYVVPQGSLAVDGVSLTVASQPAGLCRLAIIPETLTRTLIGSYRPGKRVNIEVDLVGKYVEALARTRP
jgi:riboflavin synthase